MSCGVSLSFVWQELARARRALVQVPAVMPEQSNPERTCPSLPVHEQSPTTSSWDPPSDAAQTPELSQPQLATNPIPAGARPSSLRMKSEPLRPLLEDRLEEQGSSALVTQPVALSTLHSMPKSPTAKQKHLVFMVDGEDLPTS